MEKERDKRNKLFINFTTKEIHKINDEGIIIQGFDRWEEQTHYGFDKITEYAILFRFHKVELKKAVAIPEDKPDVAEKKVIAKTKRKDGK